MQKPSLLLSLLLVAICCCAAAGQADVIVGSLPGVSSYGSSGGISAFAVGTTSCNIGTSNLNWISNNNQHPVIGQTMFRLKDGMFEQIGQSWLKHGFLALAGTTCGGPCTGSGGSVLNPGCSDPYSSGLNGSQSGLGPKFEVNAFTGFYPYPYSTPGGTGGNIARRLQVHNSDLEPGLNPGASYYVSGHYIAADDALAGNGANNMSWRDCNMSGSGTSFNASPTGTTHREEPPLFAWADADPDVQLQLVTVPGEGTFWVAFKAIDIGGGLFRWEFAVQNVDSHDSCRGFRVPLPAGGASPTSIGFHDVDYHTNDGESGNYDGTDWSASIVGNQIRWSTDTFASNDNANALRWGNMYNFRFVTDVEPTSNFNVTLDLYRSGGQAVSPPFEAQTSMTIHAGNNQVVNIGDTNFDDQFVVRVTDPMGNPLSGETISWAGTGLVIPAAGSSVTNANGEASMTATPSTIVGGPGTLTATYGLSTVAFDTFIRNLRSIAGTSLIMIWQTEFANQQLILAFDQVGLNISTPFGPICTSASSPLPSFLAFDGIGILGPQDLTIRTNTTGTFVKVFTLPAGLAGSGATVASQCYVIGAVGFDPQNVIKISNCNPITF